MNSTVDLTKVSTDALHAELTRRKAAAQAKGRPLKFATKAEWAEARAVELRAKLADARAQSQPGADGLRKKNTQIDLIEAEVQKFDRLAKKFRREGV